MRGHSKRRKVIWRRVLPGLLVAMLAVPAAASAKLDLNPQPSASSAETSSLPAGFTTDAQSSAYRSASAVIHHPAGLPASFTTDAQSGAYRSAPVAQPSVVREIHTVTTTDGGSETLAIVLALVALAIAMGGVAYGVVRVRPIVRSPLGRSS